MSVPTSRPPHPTLSSLSPARRSLVLLMRDVNFGRVEHLLVRGGEPVLAGDAATRVFRELKFGGDNGPRPDPAAEPLKPQVLELFDQFDRLGDARVAVLVVKHGVPFAMHVETPGTAA
jgi:hypothetical protein